MNTRLTIAKRLAVAGTLSFAILVAAVAIGLSRLDAVNDMVDRIVGTDWKKTVLANDAIDLMNDIGKRAFLLFHVADRKPVMERIAANREAITRKLDELEGLIYKAEGKARLAEVREKRKVYVASYSNVLALVEAGKKAEASDIIARETAPALDALIESLNRLVALQGRILEETGAAAHAVYAGARALLVGFLVAAALLSLGIALWIIRSVTRPLGGEPDEAKAVVERIAGGDLTAQIRVKAGDEASLMAATRNMQASLRKMVSDLKGNAEGVASAALQLSTASEQVATATAHQSEAASAMAAAVEEMTVSINHVSDSAREAHGVTAQTGEASRAGSGVIEDTVAEMRKISATVTAAARTIEEMGESSQKISGIVQVIKDVAEQTNLLALNAAIEAARAGEQGRGFAVVADEVRKLAERTAQATGEISGMIEAVQGSTRAAVGTMQEAVGRVEDGVGLAQRASESMHGISAGAQRVVDSVNEISNALKEQSVASNDIAANVEKIAQMSEENSAATQEAADTARRLEQLAAETRQAVAAFRV